MMKRLVKSIFFLSASIAIFAAVAASSAPDAGRDFILDTPYLQWVREDVFSEDPSCSQKVDRIDDYLRVRCVFGTSSYYTCGQFGGELKIVALQSCEGITWPDHSAAAAPDGAVWGAMSKGIKVTTKSGAETVIDGSKGLPYEEVTSIAFAPGAAVWIGTTRGAAYYDGASWLYFAGKRWLPDDRVNDIAAAPDGGAWVATDGGVVHIARKEMTLEKKALIFDEAMQARHDRDGFIADATLRTPGDLSASFVTDDDNDGQWTEMYLAAECFRYASTGDQVALENAQKSLGAMMLLLTISPAKGFPARSVLPIDQCPGRDLQRWHNHPNGKVCWKGDTSTDEVVGHMFGLPIYYDYCANDAEKQQISAAVAAMMDRIIENGYTLTGHDGKVTSDGRWEPFWINRGKGRFGDRGLNSVEILNALISAHHITGDPKYLEHYYKLIKKYGYHKNARRWKELADQTHINYDSYEMGFLSFYNLLRYEKDEKLRRNYYFEGLRLAMEDLYPIRNAEQIVIYGVYAGRAYGLDLAAWTLQELPLDLVKYTVNNSVRADIAVSEKKDRFGAAQSKYVLPFTETRTVRWSENVLALDSADGAGGEAMAQFYLLPYWMARFHGMIQ